MIKIKRKPNMISILKTNISIKRLKSLKRKRVNFIDSMKSQFIN